MKRRRDFAFLHGFIYLFVSLDKMINPLGPTSSSRFAFGNCSHQPIMIHG